MYYAIATYESLTEAESFLSNLESAGEPYRMEYLPPQERPFIIRYDFRDYVGRPTGPPQSLMESPEEVTKRSVTSKGPIARIYHERESRDTKAPDPFREDVQNIRRLKPDEGTPPFVSNLPDINKPNILFGGEFQKVSGAPSEGIMFDGSAVELDDVDFEFAEWVCGVGPERISEQFDSLLVRVQWGAIPEGTPLGFLLSGLVKSLLDMGVLIVEKE